MSKAEVRITNPRLPMVLSDIVASLEADDWCRCLTGDEKRSYYVVGFAAHSAHVSGDEDYPISEFPKPSPTSSLGESFVRSQVPLQQPDYLRQARTRLEESGVSPAAIDRFLAGELDLHEWRFSASTSHKEKLRLLTHFFEAARISSLGGVVQLDAEENREAEIAREKLCLHHISEKYNEVVERWEPLEPLSFHDPLLEEASRAYLDGFYRATVVLSACALEDRLKGLTGLEWLKRYAELVGKAVEQGFLDEHMAQFAKDVFNRRNEAAHEHSTPSPETAKEVLFKTRKVLGELSGAV